MDESPWWARVGQCATQDYAQSWTAGWWHCLSTRAEVGMQKLHQYASKLQSLPLPAHLRQCLAEPALDGILDHKLKWDPQGPAVTAAIAVCCGHLMIPSCLLLLLRDLRLYQALLHAAGWLRHECRTCLHSCNAVTCACGGPACRQQQKGTSGSRV